MRLSCGHLAALAIALGGCDGNDAPAPIPAPPGVALSPIATLTHGVEASALAFSPDGGLLASGGQEDFTAPGTVVLWDTATWRPVASFSAFFRGVSSLAFAASGDVLFGGGFEPAGGDVRAWAVPDGRLLWERDRFMPRLAVSPDGRWLAVGSSDDTEIELLSQPAGELVRRLAGHERPVLSLAFSADARRLISGSADHAVKVWSVPDLAERITLTGHTAPVWSVAFSPDGTQAASGTIDSTARLWRLSDGSAVRVLYQDDWVWSVAFSPDGELLASGGYAGVRLYRVSGGADPVATSEPTEYATRVTFSPDGRYLASALADGAAGTPGTIRIWSVSR